LEGETIARLTALRPAGSRVARPASNPAYTSWRVVPFRYRAAPGQGVPITLATLVSDHYGGARPVTADHVERFYFTRELGGTRWERWEIASGNPRFSAQKSRRDGGRVGRQRALQRARDARRRSEAGAGRLPRMDPDRAAGPIRPATAPAFSSTRSAPARRPGVFRTAHRAQVTRLCRRRSGLIGNQRGPPTSSQIFTWWYGSRRKPRLTTTPTVAIAIGI